MDYDHHSRSGSPEDDRKPAPKKRRVTKACDQCRKRRIKCETYPATSSTPDDAPCVVCTESGTASSCTFTRPSKKRGPQAGHAKSLAERVTGLERLMGHLLLVHPETLSYADSFFSPAGPASTTAAEQSAAFHSSTLPQLLELLAPAPEPKPEPKKPPDVLAATSASVSASTSAPAGPIGVSGWGANATPSSPASPFLNHLSAEQRRVLGLPATGLEHASGRGRNGGQKAMEVESVTDRPRVSATMLPALPSELVRNQLVDLYFNQVVHPSFPMVDKSRFFRWSAHPDSAPRGVAPLGPELYLAVFASVVPYLTPHSTESGHHCTVEGFAAPARKLVWDKLENGMAGVETAQSVALLALVDWGQGELERSWVLSCLSMALALQLSLHITDRTTPDPLSQRLKTFHSILIIHTFLSLRLLRAPLIVLQDYDVPLPPGDGEENFELWRSDKGVDELRADYGGSLNVSSSGSPMGGGGGARRGYSKAVRSSTLLAFNRMASLCALGVGILRFGVAPRRGNGRGLASGEQERLELVAGLEHWERELESELLLSDVAVRGVEKVTDRSRVVVEMHLLLYTLYLKMGPHISYQALSFDPVPQALAMLDQILTQYTELFTSYRSLPTLELFLHVLSSTLFLQADYTPAMHDTPRRAYEELGRVLPVARTSLAALNTKIEAVQRDQNATRVPSYASHVPSAPTLAEPLPLLSHSSFPSETTTTAMDWPQFDQSDLLVSLGLVADPANALSWQPPSMALHAIAGEGNTPGGSAVMGAPPPSAAATSPWPATLDLGGPGALTPPTGGFGNSQSTDLLTRWLDRGTLAFGMEP